MKPNAHLDQQELLTVVLGSAKEIPDAEVANQKARRAVKLWPKILAGMATAAIEILGPGYQVEIRQGEKLLARRRRGAAARVKLVPKIGIWERWI